MGEFTGNTEALRHAGAVTGLDLALITGGFTVAAVVVTFGGNYLLDRARDRRASRQARDAAIADLLTTSLELVLAVNSIRAAYQYRTGGRARLMIAAALLRDLTGLVRDRDTETRATVADYEGMVVPQTTRFFAALTVVTMGPDKKIADAARQLGVAGGALLETAAARKHKNERARSRFERELGKSRSAVDRR